MIKEAALKHSLKYGVGFVHESMSDVARESVLHLFKAGAIQVLVVTAAMCWFVQSLDDDHTCPNATLSLICVGVSIQRAIW